MRRVGFFGGSFDPIHLGHLNLAVNLLEKKGLDQIFFSPANISPEKSANPPAASKEDRRAMTQLAIEGVEGLSLVDIELQREGPSYTIDTIHQLMQEHPGVQFHLILGEDVLAGLPSWKEILSLLKLAPPLVGSRPLALVAPRLPGEILSLIEPGQVEIPLMEISSSDLRQRLLQKKYCGHLIPFKVLAYIGANGLY